MKKDFLVLMDIFNAFALLEKTIIELETSELKIEFLEHTKEFIQIRLELEKEKIQNETLLNERK
jgi:hypothetical protein